MLSYCVTSLDGREIKSLCPSEALMPASNTKLFTCALALKSFDAHTSPGEDLELLIEDKGLQLNFHGNLFFSARYREPQFIDSAITQLAEAIKETGLRQFESLHLHCESLFLKPLPDYPCVSFISFNENTLDVSVKKGKVTTSPARQSSFELIPDIKVSDQNRTNSSIFYNPQVNSEDYWRLEGKNWTYEILKAELHKHGIHIDAQSGTTLRNPQKLQSFPSQINTLDLVTSSLRFSDNFRAELLALHLRRAQKNEGLNSCLDSLRNSIDLNESVLMDGSGLSRLNRSSTRDICKLLSHMHQSKHSELWHQSMACAGQEGTLSDTSKNLLPQKRFWGKTGTLRDARALSGYYRKQNGEIVIVSVLQNQANCSKFSESVIKLLREIDEEQTNIS